jgi:ubiquinone/menaquinone biosynthesis C-methylase UbiE
MKKEEQVLKEQFKKQAKGFSDKLLMMNSKSYLKWMLEGTRLTRNMKVLDVAAGTGILSRAISPSVSNVTSIDLSEDMTNEGIQITKESGITNIEYVQGNVENLPFPDNHFDLVISRFAFHHFTAPNRAIEEMGRVSKKTVAVIDMISSEDNYLCDQYNHFERLRDLSHTKALKESEFVKLFNDLNISTNVVDTLEVPVNVNKWLQLTKTNQDIAQQIITKMNEEINTMEKLTGLYPFVHQDELMFKQKWIKIHGSILKNLSSAQILLSCFFIFSYFKTKLTNFIKYRIMT